MPFENVHGAAHISLGREFLGYFDAKLSTVATDTAGAKLVEEDPERIWIGFIDLIGAAQTISPSRPLGNGAGITITATGIQTFNLREHFLLPCLRWFCNTAVPGATILVVEVRRVAPLTNEDLKYLGAR
jgi:hypothetical protein